MVAWHVTCVFENTGVVQHSHTYCACASTARMLFVTVPITNELTGSRSSQLTIQGLHHSLSNASVSKCMS